MVVLKNQNRRSGIFYLRPLCGFGFFSKSDFSAIFFSHFRSSTDSFLKFSLEQLSELDDISYRAMMGEYIFYYRGKIIGGIYDDRFLVKPTKSAVAMMPNADMELPYEGAKEMLLVDDVDNKEFLTELLEAMYSELPAPKKK